MLYKKVMDALIWRTQVWLLMFQSICRPPGTLHTFGVGWSGDQLTPPINMMTTAGLNQHMLASNSGMF